MLLKYVVIIFCVHVSCICSYIFGSQSKRALLQSITEEHQVAIIIGSESHMESSFSDHEIFPHNVLEKTPYCIGGGGV